MPPDTQTKHEKAIVNHISNSNNNPFLSKWRRARIRDRSKANTKANKDNISETASTAVEELVPLKSILRNSQISKDAYYHNLSEAEFDAKVIENTQENKINKPTIKSILKKHDNLKVILKQAQPPDKQEMTSKPSTPSPNHLGFAEIVCELKKLKQETETAANDIGNDSDSDSTLVKVMQTNLLKPKDSLELEDDENKSEEVCRLLLINYRFVIEC